MIEYGALGQTAWGEIMSVVVTMNNKSEIGAQSFTMFLSC